MTELPFPPEPIHILDKHITCVEREVALRERVYPRWVESGRMTQRKADQELRDMRDVLTYLRRAMTEAQRWGRTHG